MGSNPTGLTLNPHDKASLRIIRLAFAFHRSRSSSRTYSTPRRLPEAILFRLPSDLPDDSSVRRTLQSWVRLGVFDRIWARLVDGCEALGSADWLQQSADAAIGKARLGDLIGPQPDRPPPAPEPRQPPRHASLEPMESGASSSAYL
ncbi:MAG TPA: hypothetical protein VF510_18240 [Ktedonobacterales bacterium]